MTESEYMTLLAEKAGVPVVTARNVLMAAKNLNVELLPTGEIIPIPGLGRMNMVSRAARLRTNPRTGEKAMSPAKNAVKIKPAKVLQDSVNA